MVIEVMKLLHIDGGPGNRSERDIREISGVTEMFNIVFWIT